MTHLDADACDEIRLDRYLDGDLDAGEMAQMEAHIAGCLQCRRQLAALMAFSQNLRERVHDVANSVDFVALEKQVLNKALRQYRSRGGLSRFIASLKYTIPATVTAGMMLQNAPPPPKRSIWPWAAATLLLITIGSFGQEHGAHATATDLANDAERSDVPPDQTWPGV